MFSRFACLVALIVTPSLLSAETYNFASEEYLALLASSPGVVTVTDKSIGPKSKMYLETISFGTKSKTFLVAPAGQYTIGGNSFILNREIVEEIVKLYQVAKMQTPPDVNTHFLYNSRNCRAKTHLVQSKYNGPYDLVSVTISARFPAKSVFDPKQTQTELVQVFEIEVGGALAEDLSRLVEQL